MRISEKDVKVAVGLGLYAIYIACTYFVIRNYYPVILEDGLPMIGDYNNCIWDGNI